MGIVFCQVYLIVPAKFDSKGCFDSKTDNLNKDLAVANEDLVDLDEEMRKTRQRYKEQYGAMEATVNSFKKTGGEYLTNYMEAQNSN